MPRFKVAHLNEQGQDMVIIPVDASFGEKSPAEQQAIIGNLQHHSQAAGLKGTVVPMWEIDGTTYFTAPGPWHPFFQQVTLKQVWSNINKEITW